MTTSASPTAREVPVAVRLGRVFVVIGGLGAAVALAFSTGLVTLPRVGGVGARSTNASAQAALAAERVAATRQWASATCTNILDWKNALHRDATSLNLGFGPVARVHDAVGATTRMLNQLTAIGLPPTPQAAQARAEIAQLRSDIEARGRSIEGAAGSVASGHLAAIGTLLSDLEGSRSMGTRVAGELRHVVSVDLGLSLAQTRSCRQLVGIPI
jgi:hypothetical protein